MRRQYIQCEFALGDAIGLDAPAQPLFFALVMARRHKAKSVAAGIVAIEGPTGQDPRQFSDVALTVAGICAQGV